MKRILIGTAFLALSAMVFAAGGQEAGASADAGSAKTPGFEWILEESIAGVPDVNPMLVNGDVISAGSSTVFPLAERMAERFNDEGYTGKITIDSIGSGAGFERWAVTAETDIANASRPIKDKEVAAAKEKGRTPITFKIGTDALAVCVSKANTFAKDVTMDELALIFSTARTWSDVRSDWPAQPILRFSPGTDSGTFDYFVEEVFNKKKEPILGAENLQLSEDDNILVQGIEGSPYAIGYFGFAYYVENAAKLNILKINGVEANKENVDAATYPLARPLFMYSDAGVMKSKPQVAAFLAFVLNYVEEEITDVGYFPTDLAPARKGWIDAMKGVY
ncbi:MAG: PstS family phosphate ABC transporter substrate-binding protein [Spirochaetales bacterium]|nr:PstS family phosphate ABC transporter substrate-binding protein [Spirochaetales bacterium]